MKKALILGLIALGFAGSQAKADVAFGISFGGPARCIAPPVVYHQSAPVYYAPAPVYQAPVCAPVYAPVYAAPVYVERRSPSIVIGFGGYQGYSHGGYYSHGYSGYRGYSHGSGYGHGGYHGGGHYGGHGGGRH